MSVLLILIGVLLLTWHLEARQENGAAERAAINRKADADRRTARKTPVKRSGRWCGWYA